MANNSASAKLTMKITSFVLRLLLNIFFYIIVVILTISVSKLAYNFTYQLYGPVTVEAAPGTDVNFVIQKSESTMDVASKLELGGLVKNKYAFYLKSKLQKAVIMPGTYQLNTSMTSDQIVKIITDLSASIDEGDSKKGSGTGTGDSTAPNTNAE